MADQICTGLEWEDIRIFIALARHGSLGVLRMGMWSPSPRELWLVTRRQDSKDLSIRTVADFMMDVFRDERDLFEW